jgi:hypothetical protein
MRLNLLAAVLLAVALTIGAVLGFLAEQATQPSDLTEPSHLSQPPDEPD